MGDMADMVNDDSPYSWDVGCDDCGMDAIRQRDALLRRAAGLLSDSIEVNPATRYIDPLWTDWLRDFEALGVGDG